MADNALPTICVEECGECIHQIFNNAEDYKGKTLGIASEKLKIDEYAAILSKAVEDKTFVAGDVCI